MTYITVKERPGPSEGAWRHAGGRRKGQIIRMKTIFVKEIPAKLLHGRKVEWRKVIPTAVFLLAMFFLGRATAETLAEARMTAGQPAGESTAGAPNDKYMEGALNGESAAAIPGGEADILQEAENWGLGFGQSGEKPTGNATIAEMKEYDAYYMAEGDEKILYLTFDCGYENGNTAPILDALEKHNAKAAFFVVGHFLESAPDLVKRMVEGGHIVGNHTYHHPDMSKISDAESFAKEVNDAAALFKEITGQEMAMYYRPPQGKYSTVNLQMAKDMGYSTFFWSLAYVDWNVDDQPSHEEALDKLTKRVHPGAIVLLHNTSKTNGEILDELLTKWEEMGYTFGTLEDFAKGT